MSDTYSGDYSECCPEIDRAKLSKRQLWYKKYKYCLNDCQKCSELQILKKILWELRKSS